mmetsp:Transcript_5269/g.13384  ORF Transcript_5269/g.13384 Transcript_5269/m.13384 type:complete len:205 (+) Transcript_5269:95-709(+)
MRDTLVDMHQQWSSVHGICTRDSVSHHYWDAIIATGVHHAHTAVDPCCLPRAAPPACAAPISAAASGYFAAHSFIFAGMFPLAISSLEFLCTALGTALLAMIPETNKTNDTIPGFTKSSSNALLGGGVTTTPIRAQRDMPRNRSSHIPVSTLVRKTRSGCLTAASLASPILSTMLSRVKGRPKIHAMATPMVMPPYDITLCQAW